MRRGFTIIEIVISVIIISIVVLGVVKINRQSINMAEYISMRNKTELSNSLFLTKEAFRYNKSEKDAYTIINGSKMKIRSLKTKRYLQNLKRKIFIRELETLESEVPMRLNAIMLQSEYSTKYFRFHP